MILGDNTTITTYRLVDDASVTEFDTAATITDAAAFIDAPTSEMLAVLGDQPGVEVYQCHVDPDDYIIGDKIVDAQGNEYRIASIERHENNTDTDDVFTLMLHKQTAYYNT